MKKTNNTKQTGFKAPKNYFFEVESFIENALIKNNTPVVSQKKTNKIVYITGIAAAILIILGLSFFLKPHDELSYEILQTYLLDSALDSYELADIFNEVKLFEADGFHIDPSYDIDTLEAYLLENADIETLLIQ